MATSAIGEGPFEMRAEPTPAGSVELGDYVLVLKRQFALILAVAVLGAAAAAAYSFRRTPVYQATSTVLVRAITTNAFDPGQRVDQQLNMSNQRQIVLSEAVAAMAVTLIGTTATPEQLLEHVSVEVPANSQVVRISYRDPVPASAQRGADAVAHAYLAFRENDARQQAKVTLTTLQKDVDRLQRQADRAQKVAENPDASATARQAAQAKVQALNARLQPLVTQLQSYLALNFSPGTVIAPADLPSSPASPKHKLDVGIGLLIGLLLAVGLAFLRDRSDLRLRGRDDLAERLDRPVLAAVPRLSRWRRDRRLRWRRRHRHNLVTLEEPNSPAAEAYRSLRARMAGLATQLEIGSIMVVSAGVGEGKSTTAANLAVALAETGREVLLVSADLRRPRVHQFFGLANREGLSDLLTGSREAVEPVPAAPHLWVLLSGPLPRHPSALMDSDAMRGLLARWRDRFDFVVLDCPPGLVVADALALAPLVDAVLVVGDARVSDREAIGRLREELEQVGGAIVGAVLNRSRQAARRSYYDEPDRSERVARRPAPLERS
jgi:capsular exopolysaccharide synthesis family protein